MHTKIAFRNVNGKYLSIAPYGDIWKTNLLRILITGRRIQFPVPIIQLIIDLTYNKGQDNCGFYFEPGTVNDTIGFTEIFQTIEVPKRSYFGIKTLWGTFLRSPTWSNSVLQSPHCRGDEFFTV